MYHNTRIVCSPSTSLNMPYRHTLITFDRHGYRRALPCSLGALPCSLGALLCSLGVLAVIHHGKDEWRMLRV